MITKIINPNLIRTVYTINLVRSLYVKPAVKETPYIPGVQGYSPEFAPPPPPKRKPKKNNKTEKKAIPMPIKKEKKVETYGKKELSYKEKLTMLRKQYLKENQVIEQEREKQALDKIAKQKEIEEKEKQKIAEMGEQIIKQRQQDYLSSLNVLNQEELEAASGMGNKVNPFTDAEAKARRQQIKKQHFQQNQEQISKERKQNLLQNFYKAKEYVTPYNLQEYLIETIDKQGSGKRAFFNYIPVFTSKEEGSMRFNQLNRTRFNILQDTLNDTFNGQPNLDHILKMKEQGNSPSSWTLNQASNVDSDKQKQ